jgi:ABC-2 type transport system ATP-binding protein
MITLRGVTKRFGAATVLDALDLEIPTGQRVALVGSNGAGKTTFFRCLLGEYLHDGETRLFGRDPRRERAAILGAVGFVPQIAPPLKMPVGALISYVADVTGSTVERIEAVAAALGLDVGAIRARPFVKLSGGMKQKLLIATALGRDPRLLILDEPAANLDPAARRVLFDLLADRVGATMIISSHRLDEIAPLVERVVELERGRVILDDVVANAGALGTAFAAIVEITAPEPAFARAAAEWGLEISPDHRRFTGAVAGPDRLRFLGFVARHSGLVSGLQLKERDDVDHAA